MQLNVVKDNVRHLTLIQRFWAPLYSCNLQEISHHLYSLILCIRSVYKNSHYFNTSERISGFLVKVTNQLVMASQEYLTEMKTIKFWDQDFTVSLKKIEV